MLQTKLICILSSWLMTGSAAVTSELSPSSDLLPALQRQPLFHGSASYYLPAGEDWRPGGSTLISVLMADQPLQFRTDPTGSKSGLQSVRLLYKCSSTDADFKEVLLESSDQSSTHCQPLRPFVLERVSASLYRLTLLRENGVAFEQALRHSLEFRLRLSFYQGELESASLFVFNFDALTKIPKYTLADNPTLYSNFSYLRGTDPCVDAFPLDWNLYMYLKFQSINMIPFTSNATSATAKLQLLRREFLDALHQSEPMVRNLLYLTVFYSRNCSDSRETPVVLATAGLGGTVGRSSFKPLKQFLLDPDSGMLHIVEDGFALFLEELYKTKGVLDACLSVSVKGGYWPYRLPLRLTQSMDFEALSKRRRRRSVRPPGDGSDVSHVPVGLNVLEIADLYELSSKKEHHDLAASIRKIPSTAAAEPTPALLSETYRRTRRAANLSSDVQLCNLSSNRTYSRIQLPGKLFNVSLACPVFCRSRFRTLVQFDGHFCSSQRSGNTDPRPPCSSFFSVKSDSCEIDLVGPTSRMHSGNYTIIAAKVKYTYYVRVVSLPVFTPESLSTDSIDFNPTFAPANISCAISYYGISPIFVLPEFRMKYKLKLVNPWLYVSPRDFGKMVLDGNPASLVLTKNDTENFYEIFIRAESKKTELWWLSWEAAFECSASASKADALLFNLPHYQVKATWNLVYNKLGPLASDLINRYMNSDVALFQSLSVLLISLIAIRILLIDLATLL